MEVRGQQPGGADEARQRFKETRALVARSNRARVRRAREVLQTLSERRLEHRRAVGESIAETNQSPEKGAVQGKGPAASEQGPVERTERSAGAKETPVSGRTEEVRSEATPRTQKQDRLELSKAARAVSSSPDEARLAKVEQLRTAFLQGRLNTPERIETAAQRMLGS
jgi:hypothetical protein